jgi:hypothetical protein
MHKTVYRLEKGRLIALLALFGVPALMIFFGARRDELNTPGWWAGVGVWLLLALLPVVWTFRTKLELSDKELTLCEGVFTLHTSWKNVRALALTPGAEGAVLHEPLPEKQARRYRRWALASMAAADGAMMGGLQTCRWIDEGLFVPLKVFSDVARSAEFQRQVRERVPDLMVWSPADIALEEEKSDRARNIWTFE